MKNSKFKLAAITIVMMSFPTASHADHLVNNTTGKATQIDCEIGPPVTWTNSDGTSGTDTYNNFSCLPSGAVVPDVNIVSADVLFDFDQPISNATPYLTFDEALAVCRKNRKVGLQECVDQKSGQRIISPIGANPGSVRHDTAKAVIRKIKASK